MTAVVKIQIPPSQGGPEGKFFVMRRLTTGSTNPQLIGSWPHNHTANLPLLNHSSTGTHLSNKSTKYFK